MAKNTKVQDTEGKWLFVAPVGNLALTKDVSNEYAINRVTFVTGAKFRRIFPRLKLDKSHLKKGYPLDKMLVPEQSFAYVHHSGKPSEIKRTCFQLIRDELDILAASQLYYRRRMSMSRLGLVGEFKGGINKHAFLNKNNHAHVVGSGLADCPLPLTLDKHWKWYHKKFFFLKFLKILQGHVPVKPQWAADIARSVMLIGKSVNSHDVGSAFLWNMVALEMLLARQGDKYSDVIPRRIESLLGWMGYWKTADFHKRIDDVYSLRCKVVHDGRLELVEAKDLLFTEDLLMNVLVNLLRHPKLFQKKEDVINFAELVSAEHLLGQKSRVRPKTLMFVKRKLNKKDYKL